MHSTFVYTLLSLAPLAARADLQIDTDDISQACSAVCRPSQELSQTCEVNDDLISDDRTENLLELQCFCLNDSFDVANLTALCASCMQQNPVTDNDDDDDDDDDDNSDDHNEDINEIMSRCSFQSATYAASQSTAADGIVVTATRLTSASQLTTTVDPGATASTTSTASTITGTGTSSVTGSATESTATPTATSTTVTTSAAGGFLNPLGKGWTMLAASLAVGFGWVLV